jgi:hypothetical protein
MRRRQCRDLVWLLGATTSPNPFPRVTRIVADDTSGIRGKDCLQGGDCGNLTVMKRPILWLTAFALGWPPAVLQATESVSYLDDPAGLFSPDPAWVRDTEGKLTTFERISGIKILVQFHPVSPAAEEDKVPGLYMRTLAGKLGVERRGVLLVYFADDPDWRVWVGDEQTARFSGKPGTVAELTANGAIHDAKEAMLAAAKAQAAEAFAALQKTAPPDRPLSPARHLAMQIDALIEALMGRLSAR